MKTKIKAHSSPYFEAAQLLSRIWDTHKSIKALSYDKQGNLSVSKQTYAVVSHVLQYEQQISQAVASVGSKLDYNNKALLFILIHEQILSDRQSIRGGGGLQRMIKKNEKALRKALSHVDIQQQPTDRAPRHVRINTCLTTPQDFMDTLAQKVCNEGHVHLDPFVQDVVVVPKSATALIQQHLGHKAVLQSQPSCFPAYCLSRYHETGDVLDACAAPGNKTTQLAALLPNVKNVFAWDRDPERSTLLERRTTQLCPGGRIKVQHTDFLETPIPSTVSSILLDPSCSGNHACDERRIKALAAFQTTALVKALECKYVSTVVYSTCSTQQVENEGVVATALSKSKSQWKLVPAIPSWPTRGRHNNTVLTEKESTCLLRMDNTAEAQRGGFFVACFVRRNRKVNVEWTVPNTLSLPVYQNETSFLAATTDVVEPAVEKSTTTGVSKKRKKKMEWKRRQRDGKKARLAQSTEKSP